MEHPVDQKVYYIKVMLYVHLLKHNLSQAFVILWDDLVG